MKHMLQAACLAGVLATAAFIGSALAAASRATADSPAMTVQRPETASYLAITDAGPRMVAVGLRGMIMFSDDAGSSWKQARVPVDSDLVAVSFATPKQGWAVGHAGVVLRTDDAGATWVKQFAGQQLNELIVRHYAAQNLAPQSVAGRTLKQAASLIQSKTAPSLLDVWFDSPSTGTMVGTFNTIFRTRDGGKTWQPWMEHTNNPDELHFYTVRGSKGALYLAGEKGTVWRLDPSGQRFEMQQTGYNGTLFGLVTDDGVDVLAFGMRGSVFRSSDAGKTWAAVVMPRKVGITSGRRLANGDLVLVDQAGGVLRSTDRGQTFSALSTPPVMPLFGVSQSASGQVLVAGALGVRALPMP